MTEKKAKAPAADKSQGIATILIAGKPLATVTRSGDSFGWRTHGKVEVKGKDGKPKLVYKLKTELPDVKTAIAAALVYLKKHRTFKPDEVVVGDYQAPKREGFGGRRMTDSKEFQEASDLVGKLKLPDSVAKAVKAPSKAKDEDEDDIPRAKPAAKAAAEKSKPAAKR